MNLLWLRNRTDRNYSSQTLGNIDPKSLIRELVELKKLLIDSGIELSEFGLANKDINEIIQKATQREVGMKSRILALQEILSKLNNETLEKELVEKNAKALKEAEEKAQIEKQKKILEEALKSRIAETKSQKSQKKQEQPKKTKNPSKSDLGSVEALISGRRKRKNHKLYQFLNLAYQSIEEAFSDFFDEDVQVTDGSTVESRALPELINVDLAFELDNILELETSDSDPEALSVLTSYIECLGNPSKLFGDKDSNGQYTISEEMQSISSNLEEECKRSKLVKYLTQKIHSTISHIGNENTDYSKPVLINSKQVLDEIYNLTQNYKFLSKYIPEGNNSFDPNLDDIDFIQNMTSHYRSLNIPNNNPLVAKQTGEQRTVLNQKIKERYSLIYKLNGVFYKAPTLNTDILTQIIRISRRNNIDLTSQISNPVPKNYRLLSLYFDSIYESFLNLKSIIENKPINSKLLVEALSVNSSRKLLDVPTIGNSSKFGVLCKEYTKNSLNDCIDSISSLPISNETQREIVLIFTNPSHKTSLSLSIEELIQSEQDIFISIAKKILERHQNILKYFLAAIPSDY